MKKLLSIMFLAVAPSSCSSGTTSITSQLGGVETTGTDIGRFTAWGSVEQKKVEAINDN